MGRPPPVASPAGTLRPYTTLFRSGLMLEFDWALATIDHCYKFAVSRRFIEGAANQLVGEHGEIVGDDVINFLIGPDFRHALLHHRVVRHRPFMPGIVHHEIDEDRQQATEQLGAKPEGHAAKIGKREPGWRELGGVTDAGTQERP